MTSAGILALVSTLLDDLNFAIGTPSAIKQGIILSDAGELALSISDCVPDLGVVVP